MQNSDLYGSAFAPQLKFGQPNQLFEGIPKMRALASFPRVFAIWTQALPNPQITWSPSSRIQVVHAAKPLLKVSGIALGIKQWLCPSVSAKSLFNGAKSLWIAG